MNYSLDRIENDIVVLIDENGKKLELLSSHLPKEAKEGDMITMRGNAFVVNKDETYLRRALMEEKLKKILKK